MTADRREAARLLYAHRQAGTTLDALPPALRPRDADEGLAIQAELPAVAGSPLVGWKIAATSEAGQAHIHVDRPLPGRILADDACCGRFAFGPAAPEGWRTIDLASHRVQATVTGTDGRETLRRDGEGRAVLGDPRTALTWLVNTLSAQGIRLAAGHWVSAGTCMVPLAIAPGDRVDADFGVLGRITLAFAD